MTPRQTATRKPAARVAGRTVATKARGAAGRLKQDRIESIGIASRTRAHISAQGRRAQARRDAR